MGDMAERNVEKKLLDFIESQVETLKHPVTSPYIYKVPKELFGGHPEYFEPLSIPIGPLHRLDSSPAQLEFKKRFLKSFIDRLHRVGVSKARLVEAISSVEASARHCYRDVEAIGTYEFAEILMVDGCFVCELLLVRRDRDYDGALVGFVNKVPVHVLQQDLLKVENQLPFLVLEAVADLVLVGQSDNNEPESSSHPVIDLALKFFTISKPTHFIHNPRHLLELAMDAMFHNSDSFPPSRHFPISSDQHDITSLNDAKSASELELYGVQFRAGDPNNLSRIEFSNGVLVIPQLVIQEATAPLFWNFYVYEMCATRSRVFASYAVFMDMLINNEKDVEVLLCSKILVIKTNNVQSLVSLFNDMRPSVSPKDFYFAPVVAKLNRYCKSAARPQRAYLVRNYYDARWDVLNSALIFIFTVTQTLFSILSYKPKG